MVSKVRGFADLGLIGAVVAITLLGAAGLALYLKGVQLERCRAEHAQFVADVKAAGEAAKAEKERKEAEDAKRIKTAVSERDAALAKLRQSNSRGRRVSAATSAAAGSHQICFGAQAYNAAVERYRGRLERSLEGIAGIAQEGAAAQIDAVALIKAWPLKLERTLSSRPASSP